MQSRWPFFFATLLLSLITFLSLQVWVQEQTKVRQALLDSAARKPSSLTSIPKKRRSPQPRFASSVTAAEVKTAPYTQSQRSPFQLPTASFDIYDKNPITEPVASQSTNLAPHVETTPEFEPASNPAEVLDDNAWEHDTTPDRNEEPNSPRNNLEKLAELLPPPETDSLLDSLDPNFDESHESVEWMPEESSETESLDSVNSLDSFEALNSPDLTEQNFTQIPQDKTDRQPLVKFASTAKLPQPRLLSTVGLPHRPPSQPWIEIEIPEWDPYAAWPKPTALLEQLEEFKKFDATKEWANETIQLLKLLHWTKSIDAPNATVIFEQLSGKLQELDDLCIQISTAPVQQPDYAQGYLAGQLRTFRYDIARRIVLWSQMHQIAVQNRSQIVNQVPERNPMVQTSEFQFVPPNLIPEWTAYLELDQLTQSLNSLQPDIETQRIAARQTLTRFFSSALKAQHRQYLDPYFSDQLIGYLREKAAAPVELGDMLKLIEYHEKTPSGYSAAKINELYQSLLWSTNESSQQLAALLDSHYRNANFRVSISDDFLNRMIPQQPETMLPIHETVMGARVRGNGRINNRLRIRLLPDNRRVNLRLEADGVVRSLTRAERSGFTVDNQGQTHYQAVKNLAIGRNGVQSDVARAYSQTKSKVLRMRSDYDPIPLVGWMARRIARDKIATSTPAVEYLADQKIQHSAKQEIETQVHQKLESLNHYLANNLMQPLTAMEMEPAPLEMRTTHDRIIMRYRLAGRDQMAAHTSRPRALAGSLMSLQLHESMLNNLLERIDLKGNEFTAQELVEHLHNVFGSDQIGSNEIDAEAKFVFAPYDPLRIRFVDNKVELSLNLKKFRIGKGKTWKNLRVKATYLPTATGMRLALSQEEAGISLKGSNLKLRDQIAVRTVFTALFENRYELNILPKNLGEKFHANNLMISQLAITDGWIGISLNEQTPVALPYQTAEQTQTESNVPVYNYQR